MSISPDLPVTPKSPEMEEAKKAPKKLKKSDIPKWGLPMSPQDKKVHSVLSEMDFPALLPEDKKPKKVVDSPKSAPTPHASSPIVRSLLLPDITPRTKRARAAISRNTTPEKTYGIKVDAKGKHTLELTPGVKKVSRVIYMFRRKSDGKVLIGKTEGPVAKRASSYMSSVNHPEKDRGKLPLPAAVRKNPDDFEFGILCKDTDGIDLEVLEREYIEAKNALVHGFNQRRGGGGSHAASPATPITPERIKRVCTGIIKDFISPPDKKEVIKKANGKFQVKFSPNSKKSKKVIYVFKNTATGERYVGRTMRELNKRISEHLHYASRAEKDAGKAPLQEAIREDHSVISTGILYHVPEDQEDMIDDIEKAFIKHYNSVDKGYNRNEGGGGGH